LSCCSNEPSRSSYIHLLPCFGGASALQADPHNFNITPLLLKSRRPCLIEPPRVMFLWRVGLATRKPPTPKYNHRSVSLCYFLVHTVELPLEPPFSPPFSRTATRALHRCLHRRSLPELVVGRVGAPHPPPTSTRPFTAE